MKNFLLILLICIFLTGCISSLKNSIKSSFKKPAVTIENFNIDKINLDGFEILFKLNIYNPNPLTVDLKGSKYFIALEGKDIFEGAFDKNAQINSKGNSSVDVPVFIKFDKIKSIIKDYNKKDVLNYKISGSVFINTFLGKYDIPYSSSGKIPTIKLPKINFLKTNLINKTPIELDYEFQLEVFNPNSFNITVSDFLYNFKVSQRDVFTGNISNIKIEKKDKNIISIPIKINYLDLASSLIESIKQKSISFNAEFNLKFSTPYGNFNIPFNIDNFKF